MKNCGPNFKIEKKNFVKDNNLHFESINDFILPFVKRLGQTSMRSQATQTTFFWFNLQSQLLCTIINFKSFKIEIISDSLISFLQSNAFMVDDVFLNKFNSYPTFNPRLIRLIVDYFIFKNRSPFFDTIQRTIHRNKNAKETTRTNLHQREINNPQEFYKECIKHSSRIASV